MAEKVIGVDVGTNAVRVAEVAVGPRPELLRFGQVGLPAGAVVEGEVADPDAVAAALRRLWADVGLRGRSVRVGLASARVILRVVDVPALSDDDTRSALALQLGDYVPLAPEATVFGFQAVGTVPGEAGEERRLLLAAAHVDAVRPLVEAVSRAGLRVEAVDVIPAALARALAPAHAAPARPGPLEPRTEAGRAGQAGPSEPGDPTGGAEVDIDNGFEPPAYAAMAAAAEAPTFDARDVATPASGFEAEPQAALAAAAAGQPVDAIVSIGAGTTVVVVARGGVPLFSRTITNVSGRHATARVADELGVAPETAEGAKRGLEPAGEGPAVAAALAVTRPLVEELVDEVADSLGYYTSQPAAVPVDRVLLTGGGSLLAGTIDLLAARLGLPVSHADPSATVPGVPLGFEPEDLPYLAPYLPAAIGVALAGGRVDGARIDLAPPRTGDAASNRRRLIIAGVVALVLLSTGALFVHRRSAIRAERAATDTALAALRELQAQVSGRDRNGTPALPGGAAAVAGSAQRADIDWVVVGHTLDGISASLGISVSSLQGQADAPAGAPGRTTGGASAATAATTATTATAASTTSSTAAGSPAPAGSPGGPGQPGAAATAPPAPAPARPVGHLSLTLQAPNVPAVAAWVDAVNADARFAGTWVSAVSPLSGDDAGRVQFNAQLQVTSALAVARPALGPAPTTPTATTAAPRA